MKRKRGWVLVEALVVLMVAGWLMALGMRMLIRLREGSGDLAYGRIAEIYWENWLWQRDWQSAVAIQEEEHSLQFLVVDWVGGKAVWRKVRYWESMGKLYRLEGDEMPGPENWFSDDGLDAFKKRLREGSDGVFETSEID